MPVLMYHMWKRKQQLLGKIKWKIIARAKLKEIARAAFGHV
jgi:hypothetical protein